MTDIKRVAKIMIVQEIYNEFYNYVGWYQVNVGVQLGTLLQTQALFGLDLLHLQLLLLRNHFLLQILLLLHHWGNGFGGHPCIRDCSRRRGVYLFRKPNFQLSHILA